MLQECPAVPLPSAHPMSLSSSMVRNRKDESRAKNSGAPCALCRCPCSLTAHGAPAPSPPALGLADSSSVSLEDTQHVAHAVHPKIV